MSITVEMLTNPNHDSYTIPAICGPYWIAFLNQFWCCVIEKIVLIFILWAMNMHQVGIGIAMSMRRLQI